MKTRKYKVLIVDDEPAMRDIIATLLSSDGHLCYTASDGIEALKRTEREYFDAVITDVVMPHMDGITLTKELLKRNPSLAVAVMTGFSNQYTAEDVAAVGASDFLNKPFAIDEFSARFVEMMREHETRHQTKGM
jgi:DNA-binding NtrC family response regulator